MSKKDLLDDLSVSSPCKADWDSMVGNDQVRFCQHCNLSVHNLSELTRKHALKLIAKSSGRVCVKYVTLPTGAIKTRSSPPSIHRIGRHASRIAAGAFGATLTVSGAAAARVPFDRSLVDVAGVSVSTSTRPEHFTGNVGGSIRGFVFDPNGAVIPGASVALTCAEKSVSLVTITTGDGEYRFDELESGTYTLKIEANGFATTELPGLTVRNDREDRIDQTLGLATIQESVEISGSETTFEVQGAAAMPLADEPLVRAAQSDDIEAVKQLLVGKPNPNVRDKRTDSTALEHAVLNANREMAQLLILAGADVNSRDRMGQTPLMMLQTETTPEAVWDLINAGAKVNLRDNEGDTALIEAAACNNLEVIKVLLEAGAKASAKNNDGQTALMKAAEEGLVNNVRTLILAGADINARDVEGKTAWAYAFESNRAPVLRLLRSYGAGETLEAKKP